MPRINHYQYEPDYLDVYAGMMSPDPFMMGYVDPSCPAAGGGMPGTWQDEVGECVAPAQKKQSLLGLVLFGAVCVGVGVALGIPVGAVLGRAAR